MPISQWMLELVPPSLDSSFWYQSASWRLSLIKAGMDVIYCSLSQWYNIFGHRMIGPGCLSEIHGNNLNGCFLVSGWFFVQWFFLYYSLRPARAAAKCSELMGSPDIRLQNPVSHLRFFNFLSHSDVLHAQIHQVCLEHARFSTHPKIYLALERHHRSTAWPHPHPLCLERIHFDSGEIFTLRIFVRSESRFAWRIHQWGWPQTLNQSRSH